MIDRLLSWLAPHYCCSCDRIGELLCDSCKYNIILKLTVGCLLCGNPESSGICPTHSTPFDQAWYVGDRTYALKHIINKYKFERARELGSILGSLLANVIPPLEIPTVLIPIPTSQTHTRQRGYDHLNRIIQSLAHIRKLSIQNLLERTHDLTQHQMDRRQRLAASLNSFTIHKPVNDTAHYLIIDDVFTTGATVTAAAHALRRNGAAHVSVAVIARQPDNSRPLRPHLLK